MSQRSLCTGCGAAILWAYTSAGKRMPLDAEPSATAPGSYRIEGNKCYPAEPLTDPPGTVTHMNHWASCPVRDSFRSKKP